MDRSALAVATSVAEWLSVHIQRAESGSNPACFVELFSSWSHIRELTVDTLVPAMPVRSVPGLVGQYAVTGWGSKLDLQFASQSGST